MNKFSEASIWSRSFFKLWFGFVVINTVLIQLFVSFYCKYLNYLFNWFSIVRCPQTKVDIMNFIWMFEKKKKEDSQ